jgi:hypothetical protein
MPEEQEPQGAPNLGVGHERCDGEPQTDGNSYMRIARMATGSYPHAGELYVEFFAGPPGQTMLRVSSGFVPSGPGETEAVEQLRKNWTGPCEVHLG